MMSSFSSSYTTRSKSKSTNSNSSNQAKSDKSTSDNKPTPAAPATTSYRENKPKEQQKKGENMADDSNKVPNINAILQYNEILILAQSTLNEYLHRDLSSVIIGYYSPLLELWDFINNFLQYYKLKPLNYKINLNPIDKIPEIKQHINQLENNFQNKVFKYLLKHKEIGESIKSVQNNLSNFTRNRNTRNKQSESYVYNLPEDLKVFLTVICSEGLQSEQNPLLSKHCLLWPSLDKLELIVNNLDLKELQSNYYVFHHYNAQHCFWWLKYDLISGAIYFTGSGEDTSSEELKEEGTTVLFHSLFHYLQSTMLALYYGNIEQWKEFQNNESQEIKLDTATCKAYMPAYLSCFYSSEIEQCAEETRSHLSFMVDESDIENEITTLAPGNLSNELVVTINEYNSAIEFESMVHREEHSVYAFELNTIHLVDEEDN